MTIEMRDTDLKLVRERDGLSVNLRPLQGEAYATHGVFRRGDIATSALLAGFSADVSAVLDAS